MGFLGDTSSLERAALKTILSSQVVARLKLPSLRDELFTSPERQFILDRAVDLMSRSKGLLTRRLFEYEVDTHIDDKQRSFYISEWELIDAQPDTDPIDALIEKLELAHTGRQIIDVAEDVMTKLEGGGVEDALAALKRRAMTVNLRDEGSPVVDLYDVDRRKKLIEDKKAHPEKYAGIKTGFADYDKRVGGVYRNELFLLAGVTGTGKSTLCKQLAYNIVHLNPGVNVLHVANEEHLEQVESKYDAVYSEIPYNDFKRATISDADMDKWLKLMQDKGADKNVGKVFVKEVPAFTDVTLVEQAVRELENKGYKIDVIIIDHLPHIMPIEKAWGENDERAKAASDCKQLAKGLHCAVIVPTQAATEVEKKQEKGRRASKMDVYGSKGQVHVANVFVMITIRGLEGPDTLEDWQKDVVWCADVKKNRDGPGFLFGMKHIVNYGRVEDYDLDSFGGGAGVASGAISAALASVEKEAEDEKVAGSVQEEINDFIGDEVEMEDEDVIGLQDDSDSGDEDHGDAWEPPEDDRGDAWEPPEVPEDEPEETEKKGGASGVLARLRARGVKLGDGV